MLKKEYRIKKTKEYENIYKYGKKFPGKYIIVFIRENNLKNHRFGVVTSKKIGNAVKRNQIKRQLRAVISGKIDEIKGHNDIVIVARYNAADAAFKNLERDFSIVMRRAGLF